MHLEGLTIDRNLGVKKLIVKMIRVAVNVTLQLSMETGPYTIEFRFIAPLF